MCLKSPLPCGSILGTRKGWQDRGSWGGSDRAIVLWAQVPLHPSPITLALGQWIKTKPIFQGDFLKKENREWLAWFLWCQIFRIQHIPSETCEVSARKAGVAPCLLMSGAAILNHGSTPTPLFCFNYFLPFLKIFFSSSRLPSNPNNAKFPSVSCFSFLASPLPHGRFR